MVKRDTPTTIPGREELLRLLAERARDGHVPAMRLLLDELRRDEFAPGAGDDDPFAAFDELAARSRGSRTGG